MRLFAVVALVAASAMTGSTACSGGAEPAQPVLGTDWTYTHVAVYKNPANGTFSGGLYVTNLTDDRIAAVVTVLANAGPSTDCPGLRLGVLSASVMLTPGDTEYVGLTSLDKYSKAPCLDVSLTRQSG